MYIFFFFNDTATTEIYTLSLHDALPIWFAGPNATSSHTVNAIPDSCVQGVGSTIPLRARSEEHTSELQSRLHLVCRLLLEKKQTIYALPFAHTQLHSTHSSLQRYLRPDC